MALGNRPSQDDQIMADINVTPLIDIMLVLLIIFMVTSSVTLESGLDIDLPKTSGQTESKGPEAVIISLSKTGELSVAGQKINWEDLTLKVGEALAKASSKIVILEGDKEATLEKAMSIMDMAKKAGAEKFAIATEQGVQTP